MLVAYDVTDDKRRSRLHAKLKGYGEALQYSLFRCSLTPSERVRLRGEAWELIDHATDRVVLVDLGPDEGRGQAAVEFWGKPLDDPAVLHGPLIV